MISLKYASQLTWVMCRTMFAATSMFRNRRVIVVVPLPFFLQPSCCPAVVPGNEFPSSWQARGGAHVAQEATTRPSTKKNTRHIRVKPQLEPKWLRNTIPQRFVHFPHSGETRCHRVIHVVRCGCLFFKETVLQSQCSRGEDKTR